MTVVNLNPPFVRAASLDRPLAESYCRRAPCRALSSYLDDFEWEKLRAEMDAFQGQLPALMARYHDEYVAMHEGQVIDHDPDLRTLHSRVYAVMGSVPVLLQKMTDMPTPDILVRGPRSGRAVRLA